MHLLVCKGPTSHVSCGKSTTRSFQMPLSVAFNPSLTSGVRAAPDERQPAQELIIASPVRYHQPARLDHASPGTWTSPAPRQSPREMPVAESPKLEVSSAGVLCAWCGVLGSERWCGS